MKRSGIKKPTYEEALAKKRVQDALRAKNPVKRQIGTNKTKPKARRVKPMLKKLKKRLWELCREITIKRDGRDCYTCPSKDLQGSNCHLGHFISSSICSTELRYDLANLRIQCYACNIHRSGNWLAYENRLKKEHGLDYVDNLKRRNEETKGLQYREDWYQMMIARYETLVLEL